jgi:hypothetical protein
MVAKPQAPRTITIAFTVNANPMFCQTICFVFLPIFIAVKIFVGWSF